MAAKGSNPLLDTSRDFDQLEQEMSSWWYLARRSLLREFVSKSLEGKREARLLDVGGMAELDFETPSLFRVVNQHSRLRNAAFQQLHGVNNLVCSAPDELAFASNSFDLIVAGDFLQSVSDDRAALRELLRVLKDGGLLCLTVPAYAFLWSEEDERRGNFRRYRTSELRRKLTTSGFEVQRASYFVTAPFLPLVMLRFAQNMLHTSITSSGQPAQRTRIANGAMKLLLNGERRTLRHINLPFGTTVVCWARKPPLVAERVTVPAWERQWAAAPPRLTWSGS
ncbi:MAG: class I SAM-dependent methyltransferase [Candidatus Korobacteraceae bacterium]